MNVYRFRKISQVLEKRQELERQSIYFAASDELNDPMEGLRDIFWRGDEIVWSNLFKQYIYCLLRVYLDLKIPGPEVKRRELESRIPVAERRDRFKNTDKMELTERVFEISERISHRVFEKNDMDRVIKDLVSKGRKSRREELIFYLQHLHFVALAEILRDFVERGIEHTNTIRTAILLSGLSPWSEVQSILNIKGIKDERVLDIILTVRGRILSDRHLIYKLDFQDRSTISTECLELLFFDFPEVFVEQLVDNLLYPQWYIACFSRTFQNSSAWGHYADGHKGVCLIFETESTDGRRTLTLDRTHHPSGDRRTKSSLPMELHDVLYEDMPGEINFFRSMGRLPVADLIDFWYTGRDNQLSSCASHIKGKSYDEWLSLYWKNFPRDLVIKTRDWGYEQEVRLVLCDMLRNLENQELRTLSYSFSCLSGIIFGINTLDVNKKIIFDIVRRKCLQYQRKKFLFHQAYYNQDSGQIEKYFLQSLSEAVSLNKS